MPRQDDRMRPTDAVILQYLSEQGLDYPTVIAAERSFDADHARARAAVLERRGLVEAVSHEVVYRITARGEKRLAAYHDSALAVADD